MAGQNRNEKKKNSWLPIVIILLFAAPGIAVPLCFVVAIVWTVSKAAKSKQSTTVKNRDVTYTRKPESLNNCQQTLFCSHKDKSEHHVARGKEIDPWDRPDIDISKYQRKR